MNELTKIATATVTSRLIFKELSSRDRYRKQSDLKKMLRELRSSSKNVDKDDFFTTFKQLQGIKVGQLIPARDNKPARFTWGYNLKDIARVAEGKMSIDEMTPLDKDGKPMAKTDVIRRATNGTVSRIKAPEGAYAQAAPEERDPRVRIEPSASRDTIIMTVNSVSGAVQTYKPKAGKENMLLNLLREFAVVNEG